MDVVKCRQFFMNSIIDVNKDGFIDDSDVFKVLQACHDKECSVKFLLGDVKTIVRAM